MYASLEKFSNIAITQLLLPVPLVLFSFSFLLRHPRCVSLVVPVSLSILYFLKKVVGPLCVSRSRLAVFYGIESASMRVLNVLRAAFGFAFIRMYRCQPEQIHLGT